MAKKVPFSALTSLQKKQAAGRFLNAKEGDEYLYEIDLSGHVLCRVRRTSVPFDKIDA